MLSDVDRCVVIGVPNEATPARLKYRLAAAVSFVDPAARAARLRRVGGVDFDERHPGPLGLAKPCPLTDPRQFFDGDTTSGASSLGHDAFRDLVIDVGGEPRLLAAPLFPNRRAELVFLACNRFRNDT